MISSRDLHDLHPYVRALAVSAIARAELELNCKLLVTCTLRDVEEQDVLYASGRTSDGPIVTNARGGDSYHQYGLALDVVPIRNGKPVWDSKDPIWQRIGVIFKEEGFEWGGDWHSFVEFPHFQFTAGLKIADLKAGATINVA